MVASSLLAIASFLIIVLGYVLSTVLRAYPEALLGWLSSLWNSLFTTVLVGALIFLYQQDQNEAGQKQNALLSQSKVLSQITSLLQKELNDDEALLNNRFYTSGRFETLAVITKADLHTSFWDSIKETGDIKALTNLSVLQDTSRAYSEIEDIKRREALLELNTYNIAGVIFNYTDGSTKPSGEALYEAYYRNLQPARTSVSIAIASLKLLEMTDNSKLIRLK